MAKMIGKRLKSRGKGNGYFACPYYCCGYETDKTTAKIREKAEAFRLEEAATTDRHDHANGICYNPPGGYGCEYCYGEDLDDAYDNSDLDDIPGVWCNVDWRDDPAYQRYLAEERIYEENQTHHTTP